MAKQVLLIQGAGEGAHRDDAKLAGSLRSELGENYQVRYPAMPDEEDADYETWKSVILQEVEAMGEGAILVGHSIGASVLIRMFADRGPKPAIAGMFLIAGPFWHDHEFWHWDEAALPDDADKNYPRDVLLFLYHGENDEFVPVSHLDMYAKALVAWQLTARMRSIPCSFPFNHENLIDVVLKLTASVRRTGVYQPVRSVSRRRR